MLQPLKVKISLVYPNDWTWNTSPTPKIIANDCIAGAFSLFTIDFLLISKGWKFLDTKDACVATDMKRPEGSKI